MTEGVTDHVEPSDSTCPVCGHEESDIVGAHIAGRGHSRTLAIKACQRCETLWGEPKEWFGVVES